MNRTRIILGALAIIVAISAVVGQSPRSRTSSRSATPKPTPSTPTTTTTAQPTPTQPAENVSPALAVVNEITISAADIEPQVRTAIENDPDPYLHAFYEDRDKAIKEARERALTARINSMLLAAEAKKRGLTTEDFIEREINSKIAPPSDAEIRAVYDANRAQLGNADLESVRPQVINYLRGQRSEELRDALVNRLKMTNTVMKSADVNTPNLASGTVLAAVNGTPIRIEAINERMKAYVYKMEMRIYAAQKQVLDRRINDLLIVAEANRRKIGPEEIVRSEITDKIKPPTEAEIARFYEDNKARITGDLASARADIANYLQQQQQDNLERALADKLRASAKFQMLLKEPEPRVMNVNGNHNRVHRLSVLGLWRHVPNCRRCFEILWRPRPFRDAQFSADATPRQRLQGSSSSSSRKGAGKILGVH